MSPLDQTKTEKLYSKIQDLKKALKKGGNNQKLELELKTLEEEYAALRLHESFLESDSFV